MTSEFNKRDSSRSNDRSRNEPPAPDNLSDTTEWSQFMNDQRRLPAEATPPDAAENILSAKAQWDGAITFETSVRVDGRCTGEIESKETIHLASGAQVKANVRAAFVVIAGDLQGQIQAARRLDLLSGSNVEGDVTVKSLTIEAGAVFNGSVRMSGAS